jgi:hypothetical protein
MATDSDSDGSVTVSSGQNVDMEAQHAAQLSASDIRLDSDASTSMQSQGSIMLTSSETNGSVDVVAQSLTTNTSQVSLSGSKDVTVESREGVLKLSSLAKAGTMGSVIVSASNAEGVISLESGAHLDTNSASTNILATSQDGINIATESSTKDQKNWICVYIIW